MPFLLVLSAPSGGGKTTIAKMLLQGRDDLGYSVSATTRAKRSGERNGVDYHFLTRAEFEKRQKAGEFIESATYAGELYGTLKSEIERIFAQGRHAVLDVEVEGARQIRRNFPNSLLLSCCRRRPRTHLTCRARPGRRPRAARRASAPARASRRRSARRRARRLR